MIDRNGLSKSDGLQGRRDPALLAADLERLEADQTNEAHILAYAKHAGITPAQARRLLKALFRGTIERRTIGALSGMHLIDAFLARHADCLHDGTSDISGADFNHIEATRLPYQYVYFCLVVKLSLSAEAVLNIQECKCQLIDPVEVNVLESGMANVEIACGGDAEGSGKPRIATVIIKIGGPVFTCAGLYTCTLSLGDHELASVPFTVALRELRN